MTRQWLVTIGVLLAVWPMPASANEGAAVAGGVLAGGFALGPQVEINDYFMYKKKEDLNHDGRIDKNEYVRLRQKRKAWTFWSKSSFSSGMVDARALNLLTKHRLIMPEDGVDSGSLKFLEDQDRVPVIVLSNSPDAVLEALANIEQNILQNEELTSLYGFSEVRKNLESQKGQLEAAFNAIQGENAALTRAGFNKRDLINATLRDFEVTTTGTSQVLGANPDSRLQGLLTQYNLAVQKYKRANKGEEAECKRRVEELAAVIRDEYRRHLTALLGTLNIRVEPTAPMDELVNLAKATR